MTTEPTAGGREQIPPTRYWRTRIYCEYAKLALWALIEILQDTLRPR